VLVEDVPLRNRLRICEHHDAAPSHFHRRVPLVISTADELVKKYRSLVPKVTSQSLLDYFQ
jgi:hypothetical protein